MATSKKNKNKLIYEQKREICKFNLKNPNQKQVKLCASFSKIFESTIPLATMSDIIRNKLKKRILIQGQTYFVVENIISNFTRLFLYYNI